MSRHIDYLDAVVAELRRRQGELKQIADATGINHKTLTRMRDRVNDPGYSKVRALHDYLFGVEDHAEEAKAASQLAEKAGA